MREGSDGLLNHLRDKVIKEYSLSHETKLVGVCYDQANHVPCIKAHEQTGRPQNSGTCKQEFSLQSTQSLPSSTNYEIFLRPHNNRDAIPAHACDAFFRNPPTEGWRSGVDYVFCGFSRVVTPSRRIAVPAQTTGGRGQTDGCIPVGAIDMGVGVARVNTGALLSGVGGEHGVARGGVACGPSILSPRERPSVLTP